MSTPIAEALFCSQHNKICEAFTSKTTTNQKKNAFDQTASQFNYVHTKKGPTLLNCSSFYVIFHWKSFFFQPIKPITYFVPGQKKLIDYVVIAENDQEKWEIIKKMTMVDFILSWLNEISFPRKKNTVIAFAFWILFTDHHQQQINRITCYALFFMSIYLKLICSSFRRWMNGFNSIWCAFYAKWVGRKWIFGASD